MSMSAKIKYILNIRNIKITDFAKQIGTSQSNFSNKLKRDNFTEKELREIAEALNCDYDAVFTLRDTGQKV